MKYDYYKAVYDDVYDYIQEHIDELKEKYTDLEKAKSDLNDTLFVEGIVMGNDSGSYTFNSAQAREYIADNMNLGIDPYREFGWNIRDFYEDYFEDPKKADVTIRLYCLSDATNDICSKYDFEDFENSPSMKM